MALAAATAERFGGVHVVARHRQRGLAERPPAGADIGPGVEWAWVPGGVLRGADLPAPPPDSSAGHILNTASIAGLIPVATSGHGRRRRRGPAAASSAPARRARPRRLDAPSGRRPPATRPPAVAIVHLRPERAARCSSARFRRLAGTGPSTGRFRRGHRGRSPDAHGHRSAGLLGISRGLAYELVRRGDLPAPPSRRSRSAAATDARSGGPPRRGGPRPPPRRSRARPAPPRSAAPPAPAPRARPVSPQRGRERPQGRRWHQPPRDPQRPDDSTLGSARSGCGRRACPPGGSDPRHPLSFATDIDS